MAYILHINTKNSARRTLYFHKSAMQSRLLLQFCGATSHLCAVLVGKCLHICLAPVAKVIRHSTGVLCGHWGVLCDMVPCRVLCGRSTCVGIQDISVETSDLFIKSILMRGNLLSPGCRVRSVQGTKQRNDSPRRNRCSKWRSRCRRITFI